MVALGLYNGTEPRGVTGPHLEGIRQYGYQSYSLLRPLCSECIHTVVEKCIYI